jgi:hypothetical protein
MRSRSAQRREARTVPLARRSSAHDNTDEKPDRTTTIEESDMYLLQAICKGLIEATEVFVDTVRRHHPNARRGIIHAKLQRIRDARNTNLGVGNAAITADAAWSVLEAATDMVAEEHLDAYESCIRSLAKVIRREPAPSEAGDEEDEDARERAAAEEASGKASSLYWAVHNFLRHGFAGELRPYLCEDRCVELDRHRELYLSAAWRAAGLEASRTAWESAGFRLPEHASAVARLGVMPDDCLSESITLEEGASLTALHGRTSATTMFELYDEKGPDAVRWMWLRRGASVLRKDAAEA